MAGMRRHRRLTYANVASTLALLLALSGTAYAAATVTSRDIVNRTIKEKDISKAALFDILPDFTIGSADDAGAFSGSTEQTVATLDVPNDENLVVIAKVRVNNDGPPTNVFCRLAGGVVADSNWGTLTTVGAPGSTENMTFLVAEFFDASENVTLSCNPNGGSIHLFDLKITAIQVGGFREAVL